MAKLIKELRNNRSVIFDAGKFDNWCVYVVEADGKKQAPFDSTYFSDLKNISALYSNDKVYNDFVAIYDLTTKNIDPIVIGLIDQIVNTYLEEHKVIVEQWLTVLYAGMIAEENKQFAILKKRVKRLGMHQVLILDMSPSDAAKFSYGRKWRDLDEIMKPYGF